MVLDHGINKLFSSSSNRSHATAIIMMLKLVVVFLLLTGPFIGGFMSTLIGGFTTTLIGSLFQGTVAASIAPWVTYAMSLATTMGGCAASLVVSALIFIGVGKVMARMIPLIFVLVCLIYYLYGPVMYFVGLVDWLLGTEQHIRTGGHNVPTYLH